MKYFRFTLLALLSGLLSPFAFDGLVAAQIVTTPRASATVTIAQGNGHSDIEARLIEDTLTISKIPNSTFFLTSYTLKQLRDADRTFSSLLNGPDDTRFFVILFPTFNEERNRRHKAEGKGMALRGVGLHAYIKVNTDELRCGVLKITTVPGFLSGRVVSFKVPSDRTDMLLGNLFPGDEIVGFALQIILPTE